MSAPTPFTLANLYIYTQRLSKLTDHTPESFSTCAKPCPSQTASGHHHIGRQIFGAGLHRHHALSPGEGWEKCGCFFFLPGNFGNPYVLKVKTRKNPWFPVHFPYTNPLIVDTVIVLTIKMTVPWSMFKSSRYQPCSSNKAIEPPRNGGFNRKIIYRSGCLSPLMNVHRNESGFNGWAVHPMGQQHRAS